jgi:hypothetical protein
LPPAVVSYSVIVAPTQTAVSPVIGPTAALETRAFITSSINSRYNLISPSIFVYKFY